MLIHGVGRSDLNRGATSLEPRLLDFYRPAQERCAKQVFDMAGIGPSEIDAVQVYDSFSCHIPFALDQLPNDTTAGTRARIIEVMGGAPVRERW